MADTESCKIISYKINSAAGLRCDPETMEQIGGHQPDTASRYLYINSNARMSITHESVQIKLFSLVVI